MVLGGNIWSLFKTFRTFVTNILQRGYSTIKYDHQSVELWIFGYKKCQVNYTILCYCIRFGVLNKQMKLIAQQKMTYYFVLNRIQSNMLAIMTRFSVKTVCNTYVFYKVFLISLKKIYYVRNYTNHVFLVYMANIRPSPPISALSLYLRAQVLYLPHTPGNHGIYITYIYI